MAGETDPKFYSELKGMNEDLLKLLKDTLEVSPYFDLSPTLNDYVKQFAELEKQYLTNTSSSGSAAAAITTAPNTTTSNTTTSTNTNSTGGIATPAFSFGAALTGASSVVPTFGSGLPAANTSSTSNIQPPTLSFGGSNTSKPLFSFSMSTTNNNNNSNTTANNTSLINNTSKPLFSFSASTANTSLVNNSTANNGDLTETTVVESTANTGAEGGEDEPPPEPKVDRYEEPDFKYSIRCKLYERTVKQAGKDIDILGIGMLYVKQLPESPNKLQVIVRQEPDLRKVLLNEIITPTIPVKILPKAVQMSFPSANGEIKSYIAKVKDEQDAKSLFDHTNLSES